MKPKILKTGTLIWMGIKGKSLSAAEKSFIEKEEISGIILFKRNIHSLKQLYSLVKTLHQLNPSPLIAVDREGGRVDRFRHLKETAKWPAPGDWPKKTSLKTIQNASFLLHRELKGLGVDINFAPAVDVEHCKSRLLNRRLFAGDAKSVAQKALAFLKGALKANILPCIKHFPGHGGVDTDSHLGLPVDKRFLTELRQDADVFLSLIKKCSAPLLMTAHVLYPEWDPYPATLSKKIILKYLKQQKHFSGLVLSDDLDMKALACFIKTLTPPDLKKYLFKKHWLLQSAVFALEAGGDILLKCKPDKKLFALPGQLRDAVESTVLSRQELTDKIEKIRTLKSKWIKKRKVLSFSTWKQLIIQDTSHQWCQSLQLK